MWRAPLVISRVRSTNLIMGASTPRSNWDERWCRQNVSGENKYKSIRLIHSATSPSLLLTGSVSHGSWATGVVDGSANVANFTNPDAIAINPSVACSSVKETLSGNGFPVPNSPKPRHFGGFVQSFFSPTSRTPLDERGASVIGNSAYKQFWNGRRGCFAEPALKAAQ
jgi:hypothetical protein